MQSTVRIWYENLAAMDCDDRKPLSDLALNRCLHGGLRFEIAGRLVPYLGYFGQDDVCFGEWVRELRLASSAISAPGGRHIYDEGEQGQPAFVFEREGDKGYFSIVEAEFSGGDADPRWQRIEFSPADFVNAEAEFRVKFFAEVLRAAPNVAEKWLERLTPTA